MTIWIKFSRFIRIVGLIFLFFCSNLGLSQIRNAPLTKIDAERAAISSLFDKDLNRELVDQDANWKLGEFIYETLGNLVDQFCLELLKNVSHDSVDHDYW